MGGVKELNKYLKELSKEELVKEFQKLFKRFKPVKNYFESELGIDNGELLKKLRCSWKRSLNQR